MPNPDHSYYHADQDNAMENAIRSMFTKTYHRFCRWHMLKKYKDPLKKMYEQHPQFKDRFISVINHPLKPAEFEGDWGKMIEDFKLHESTTLQKLYDDRQMWIAAYYKEIFCGTMQSTQRSESMNAMVKNGYADNSTPIHEFAKNYSEMLDHLRENEAREEYYSQV